MRKFVDSMITVLAFVALAFASVLALVLLVFAWMVSAVITMLLALTPIAFCAALVLLFVGLL